jgi:hypothetical protein
MNENQAAQVLAAMGAAWPNHDMPEETIRLWLGLMADVNVEDAMPAVKLIVREDRFFPPISRFMQVCEERAHARRNREAAERGLPNAPRPTVSPDRMKQLAHGLREQLDARRGAGKHWHGGPNPCPICSGMVEP